MERILNLVALARRRLFLAECLRRAWPVASAGVLAVALAVVASRAVGHSQPQPWWGGSAWFFAALAAAIAAGAAVGAWGAARAARGAVAAAIEVDARLATGERFTTALALAGDAAHREDPFARAAIADAVRFASRPDSAARVRRAFPVAPPARAWLLPVALAAAVLAWAFVPQRVSEASGAGTAAVGAAGPVTDEERRLAQVVKEIEASPDLAKRLEDELAAAKRSLGEEGPAAPRTPEDAAREAMRRTAELQARLAELAQGPELQADAALRDALAKLELPEEAGLARDFAEALKRGDFEAASEAMQALREAIDAGSGLSPEERERLAAQLQAAADRLEALSKDPGRLADALREAGMDPSLAGNPDALEKALERSSALNESQKQALRSLARSAQASRSKLSRMSTAAKSMCKQCRNPGSASKPSDSASGSSDSDMAAMLDDAEADRMMAQAADSAASACESGGGSPSGAQGGGKDGGGADGRGRGGQEAGRGGRPELGESFDGSLGKDRYGTRSEQERGDRRDGNVIAQQLVDGDAPVGESRVALQEVASRIAPGYERGTDEDPVPAHLREVHKEYFGDLRKRLERRGVKVPAAQEPAPAPAQRREGGDAR